MRTSTYDNTRSKDRPPLHMNNIMDLDGENEDDGEEDDIWKIRLMTKQEIKANVPGIWRRN